MTEGQEERKEISTVIAGVVERISAEIQFLDKLRKCLPTGHDWKISTTREDRLPEERDCTRCGATQFATLEYDEPTTWGSSHWDELESED